MLTALLIAHLVPQGGVSPFEVLVHSAGWGFQHILPNGLDHIVFILGLFFLAKKGTELVAQVSVFTVAHSMSTGISILGWIVVPVAWVEVAVALSITFIAVEGLCCRNWRAWRLPMVAAFGIIHGLAYAHSFQEMLTDTAVASLALAGFTMGIGLGQFAVIGVASLLLSPYWSHSWYRPRVAVPATYVIGLCGLVWTMGQAFHL